MGDEHNDMRPLKKAQKEDQSKKPLISPGDVMKAIVRPGEGDVHPQKGDRVILHYTTRTCQGVVVESTHLHLGGNGVTKKYVFGKSKLIRGWEEGIPTMTKSEVAMFKVKPEFHYGDKECPVVVSESFPKCEELVFEIELVDFFPVKVLAEDLGVLKRVLREGEGWETPRQPYEVKVWLSWKKQDQVDFSPLKENEPFHFTFGKKEVPKGLELGVGSMTKREKAVIYVSSSHLMDASSIRDLPTDVDELQFEVEVVQIIQVRDLVGDGQVVKRRIQDGQGEFPMDCPLQDSVLRIHYKGILPDMGGKVFYDSRNLKDNDVGEPITFGSDEGLVPEGLEMCVKLMLPGEVALVTSTPEYAYDKFPRPDLVPEGASVQWEVELIDFEKVKDWTDLTFQEIIDEAERIRAIGNRLFKERKFTLAKAKYEKVLRDFNHVHPEGDEEEKTFVQTRYHLYLNVAACNQQLGEHVKSIEFCNKVLDENPHHVKALYRRGMSYMAVGDYDEAGADFETMLKVDKAAESEAKAALLKLNRTRQEAEAKARKQFKGLFDKKPGELSAMEEASETRETVEITQNSSEVRDDSKNEVSSPSPVEGSISRSQRSENAGKLASLWKNWRSLFTTFPPQRCTIL